MGGCGSGNAASAVEIRSGTNMRILVIDDSAICASTTRLALQHIEDVVVLESRNAETALELSADYEPDLMLVDWTMPVMSGRSMIESYRENGGAARVIVMAQESERNDMVHALRAGANHYVLKPFAPATLIRCIEYVMSRDP